LLLQAPQDGHNRLKRIILIGDHHQLPPVVKNQAFQKYSRLDQPLFTRLVRLGVPYVELSAQGRARPEIAKLYNWRYRTLGDLPHVRHEPRFKAPNAGFALDFQFVDVAPCRCEPGLRLHLIYGKICGALDEIHLSVLASVEIIPSSILFILFAVNLHSSCSFRCSVQTRVNLH
jgi:hypothetical protein